MYYCQTCGTKLLQGRSHGYWYCEYGHGKLLSREQCRHGNTETPQAKVDIVSLTAQLARDQAAAKKRALDENLPFCGLATQLKGPSWWLVADHDGIYKQSEKGKLVAFDPEHAKILHFAKASESMVMRRLLELAEWQPNGV